MGKTTCAAAIAVESARRVRTLLVSTDPASSLGDIFRTSITASPRAVPRAGRLHAANIDAPSAFKRWFAPRKDLVAAIATRGTYLDDDDVARLLRLSLPGIDEVMALLEIKRFAGGFDRVVVDTAPTGHTLRSFAAPGLLERVASVLDVLQEHHRDVVSALRGRYEPDHADAFIRELDEDGRGLAAVLRDPALTTMWWVTLPEPMALEETSDAIAALVAAEIPVNTLVVNRITPTPPQPCRWCEARRRFETRAIAPVTRRFAPMNIVAIPAMPQQPVGVSAIRRVHDAMARWDAPSRVPGPLSSRVTAVVPRGTRLRPRDVAGGVRWVLVGGKGGTGKTTCASAIALDAAADRPASRVLLLSSDPAHSLGDVFGERFDDEPRKPANAPANLWIREIDAAAGLARFRDNYLSSVDAAFDRIARGAFSGGGDAEAFRRLIDLAPPGIDEVIAIADVAEALESRPPSWDLIVTDTAPTGHALRLLQTPAILRDWVQALMAILLKYREIVAAGSLGALLVNVSRRLRILQQSLVDPSRTRFIVVTRAEALPRAESVRLVRTLRSLQIDVSAVIVNGCGAGTCSKCRAQLASAASEITRLRRDLGPRAGYAIIETPAEVPPPHGAAALPAWSRHWQRID